MLESSRRRAKQLTNLQKKKIFRLGHHGETTWPRFERRSPPLLMRGRSNQRRKRSFHPFAFYSSDPHQRVLHCRSPHVEPVRRVRISIMASVMIAHALVEAASERTRMRRRRAHTGLLLDRNRLILLGDDLVGNRSIGRDRSVID